MMMASTATCPSTLATALNLPMPRLLVSSSTSKTSWSPGITWRLKRASSMPAKKRFVFFAAAFAEDGECAAGLRHGFDDEYAGHDGQVGEMALELRLVHGDVFNRGQGFHGLEGGDAVELQKRVAVGNEFLDVFGFDGELYVHIRRIPWYFGVGWAVSSRGL